MTQIIYSSESWIKMNFLDWSKEKQRGEAVLRKEWKKQRVLLLGNQPHPPKGGVAGRASEWPGCR